METSLKALTPGNDLLTFLTDKIISLAVLSTSYLVPENLFQMTQSYGGVCTASLEATLPPYTLCLS